MRGAEARLLEGVRVLIVEDEYAVAADITWWLQDCGAVVIGPAPTVEDAISLIETHGAELDRAVLDINLRGAKSFPVADALLELKIPFIFSTGYEAAALPPDYAHVARQAKPLDRAALVAALASTGASGRRRLSD